MQRIVIDTNVLVSALMSNSYPAFVVDMFFKDAPVQWCISDAVFLEYEDVLTRPKFGKYPGFTANAESLLDDIDMNAEKFTPIIKVDIISDYDDNRFLELALACNAEFLITGNTNDFTMSSFGQTRIITPKQYWEQYRVD